MNKNKKEKIYCPICKKETTHTYTNNIKKDFINGLFFTTTQGFSLMYKTYLLKCDKCSNVLEVKEE